MKTYVTGSATAFQGGGIQISGYNSRALIPIDLVLPVFADLLVDIHYNEDPRTRIIKTEEIKVELRQTGFGFKGLNVSDNGVMIIRDYEVIHFVIEFTLQMEMPLIKDVPIMPITNEGVVKGYYDFLSRKGQAKAFSEYGEEGRGDSVKWGERHPKLGLYE